MIRIDRPNNTPPILLRRGNAERDRICELYVIDSASYDSGETKFPTADGKLYGSASVRSSLKKCQHNKCCYSEAKFNRDSVHVEHYRPKGAIGLQGSKQKSYPGYYWLAYEWGNLMLCKAGINSDKKDFFPLHSYSDRAVNHLSDISLEKPVIIDPASEDPREHIRFHNEQPYGLTPRGVFTTNLLLNNPELDESRRSTYQKLLLLKKLLQWLEEGGDGHIVEAVKIRELLAKAVEPEAEYSSMAIDLMGA